MEISPAHDDVYQQACETVGDISPHIDLVNQLHQLSQEGRVNDMRRVLVKFSAQELAAATQAAAERRASKNKSICGCPMCEFHSEAYAIGERHKGKEE